MVRDTAILKTTADQLIEFLKNKEKVTIEETAKALKIPEKTVQALVDFFVEEKVIDIEYKFTTPYIYLSKEDIKKHTLKRKKEAPVLLSKEEFYTKAKSRNLPYQKIGGLWRKYLETQLVHLKEDFYKKAKQRGVSHSGVEDMWQKYLTYL